MLKFARRPHNSEKLSEGPKLELPSRSQQGGADVSRIALNYPSRWITSASLVAGITDTL